MASTFDDTQDEHGPFPERAEGPIVPVEQARRAADDHVRFGGLVVAVLLAHGTILSLLNYFESAPVELSRFREIPVDLVSAAETETKVETPLSAGKQPQGEAAEGSRKSQEKSAETKVGAAEPQAPAEPPKQDPAKSETAKPEPPKPEPPKEEPAKSEPPKEEATKKEAQRPEPPKQEAKKIETPRAQAQKSLAKAAVAKSAAQKPTAPTAQAAQPPPPAQPPEPLQQTAAARTQAALQPIGPDVARQPSMAPNEPAQPTARGYNLYPDSFRAVAVPSMAEDGEDQLPYSTLVFSRLELSKHFPEAAKARGAHGSAGIGFTLDGSGNVLDVELLVPSGDPDLDQESVALVRRAAPFPQPPGGQQLRFDAIVTFEQ